MNRVKVVSLSIVCLLTLALFQNCEAIHEDSDWNSLSRYVFSSEAAVFAFLPKGLMAEKVKLVFQVDVSEYPSGIFFWDHEFNEGEEYCEQYLSGDKDETVEFICPSAGVLVVDLLIEDEEVGNQRFYFTVDVLSEEDIVDPGEIVGPGVALYAQFCAGCHNAIENTEYPGATASAIEGAIQSIPAMQNLTFLTRQEIEDIAAEL